MAQWFKKKKNLPANAEDACSIPGLGGPREEGMATHSSALAERIPRTEEPWQAMVYRVAKRHNWSNLSHMHTLCAVPTPVFLPGESHGQERLAGYNLWGLKGSDTAEHCGCANLQRFSHVSPHSAAAPGRRWLENFSPSSFPPSPRCSELETLNW